MIWGQHVIVSEYGQFSQKASVKLAGLSMYRARRGVVALYYIWQGHAGSQELLVQYREISLVVLVVIERFPLVLLLEEGVP